MKSNKVLKIVLLLVLFLSLTFISIGLTVGVICLKNSNLLSKLTNSSTTNLVLPTTELNTKIKEGIYITDVSEVVANTMPSIVAITSKTLVSQGYNPFGYGNKESYQEGAGSGIIISNTDSEILILTNNHVVDGSSELTVKFIDDKSYDATIKGTSSKKDVAVISVKVEDLDRTTLEQIKVAVLGSSDELKVGNGIIAIGNALGYGQSVTTGVVSALNRVIETDSYSNKMIQIDAAINGGNSGGALLNNKGEVVGINSAKYSSSGTSTSASIEGMGFAIPISQVKDLITDLMNGKESNSDGITLGIAGYMTTSSNLLGYNLPEGFYVSEITSGSYADKSKLEIGNIITEIDGNQVQSVTDITDVLESKKEGDNVVLKIKYASGRDYKEKEIKVEFK